MIRLFLAMICLASPLSAQTVTVKSGEHGDFTRIVLTLPTAGDWQIGRTETGYEVALPIAKPSYDLSDVYRLITRDRLRDLSADPVTGRLQLDIGCACHVIPFEFGPRNLVIDIRPGTAPDGSSFETPLGGGDAMAALSGSETRLPEQDRQESGSPDQPFPYGWTENSLASRPRREPILPFPTEPEMPDKDVAASVPPILNKDLEAEVNLAEFRELLVDQLGAGATQGFVEMALPPKSARREEMTDPPEQARVALSRLPGLSLSTNNQEKSLQTDGQTCPAEERLNIKDWAATNDAMSEISAAKARLLAEFDHPQTDQIAVAVKVHLYFAFGAEARNLMTSLSKNQPPDPFLVAMSYLVENERSPENPFSNMQSCDSSAALWAFLAASDTEPLNGLNGAAVARAAMELPPHVRAVLAPRVVTRLQEVDDPANARVVQNALARAVPKDDPALHMLDAEIALSENRPSEAEAHLNALDEGEATLASLFARVEARFQQQIRVDQADVLALEAFAFEQGSGAQKSNFQIALTRAYALSGAFEKAFEMADDNQGLQLDVWNTLARAGAESEIMTFATDISAEERSRLPGDLRSILAERLFKLGLPNVALGFLNDASDPLLKAEVSLANGDGREALRVLASAENGGDAILLARAYESLGQFEPAADVLRKAGQEEDAARLERWQRKWPAQNLGDTDPWARLAAVTREHSEDVPPPPLRAAQEDLDRSIETRARIDALLKGIPPPP